MLFERPKQIVHSLGTVYFLAHATLITGTYTPTSESTVAERGVPEHPRRSDLYDRRISSSERRARQQVGRFGGRSTCGSTHQPRLMDGSHRHRCWSRCRRRQATERIDPSRIHPVAGMHQFFHHHHPERDFEGIIRARNPTSTFTRSSPKTIITLKPVILTNSSHT